MTFPDARKGATIPQQRTRHRFRGFVRLLPGLFLGLLLAPGARGLNPSLRLTQYVHDSWTSNDGLPQDSINSIAQTPDGYLWLATQEGIARFDGTRFTIFDSRTTRGVIQNFVYTLFVDRTGTLWAGASGGLLRYDGKGSFTRIGRDRGWPDSSAKYISEDREGNLWAGLATGSRSNGPGKGLIRMRGGQVRLLTTRDGLSSDQVYQTWPDGGDLWIATSAGLNVMSDGRVRVYTTSDGLVDNDVRVLRKDRDGNLWIGTSHGLSRFRDGHFVAFTTTNGLLDDQINAIYEDRDGVIWVGTGKGANRFVRGELQSAAGIPGIGDDRVFSFLEDREGSLWMGTHAGGLHRLRAGKFLPWGSPEGLAGDSVSAMYEDRAGRIWIATVGGALNMIAGGRVSTMYAPHERPAGNDITTMLEDSAGVFWIGTGKGLQRLLNGGLTSPITSGLPDARINVLYEDRARVLWMGTGNGLARLVNGRAQAVPLPRGAPTSIRLLYEDRTGRFWVGGGDGLGYFSNGRYNPLIASAVNVQSVLEDGDGTLWFATWGSGLFRLRGGALKHVTAADGLFDDVAWQIVDDGRGSFWMASNRGVSRVAREELNAFADGRSSGIRPLSYGARDGMRRRETNLTQHSIIRARDGRLWFATTAGTVVVDPATISTNRLPPPVVLERFSADETLVSLTSGVSPIVLKPGQGNLEIDYVALTFVTPSRVRYRYRLEGYDRDWIDAGGRRTAFYTNIEPGAYSFRVIAANDDGVWNTAGASVRFRLTPSFRQSWWFLSLIALAVVLAGLAIQALRKRQMAIRHQVYHDALTGLPNRTLIRARAEVALTQASRLGHSIAILFLDLDGFKSVNDTKGHAVGDRLLQLVAARFRSCIREVDTLARIGGDEFAVLVADLADESRAAEVAQRLIDSTRRGFSFDGQHVALGVSIGIAIHPFDGTDVPTMLEAADRAMYRAKLAGGNAYQFNSADPAETVVI